MPRFGVINERRHRLHEVVRLSGINVSVDNDDYPLQIKVASLPNARLQVYFLDNEDFFKRNYISR
jgi:starch synthase